MAMTAPHSAAGSATSSDPTRPPVDDLTTAACLFHGFSDPHRVGILRRLARGEQRVVDLTAHLGLAQSTVSKHVACLRDCGLVTARPQGRATYYSLTQPEALQDLWAAAERLLAHTGDRVALCADHGLDALSSRGPERHPAGGVR